MNAHKTMEVRRISELMLVMHTTETPSDAEWENVVEQIDDWLTESKRPRMFVCTDKGGPNAGQRTRLAKRVAKRPYTTAVLTESGLVRGTCTAFRWFGMDVRAFEPRDFASALAALQLEGDERELLLKEIDSVFCEFLRWTIASVKPMLGHIELARRAS